MKKKIAWSSEMADPVRRSRTGYAQGDYPELSPLTVDEMVADLTGEIVPHPLAHPSSCICYRCHPHIRARSVWHWQLLYGLAFALVEIAVLIFGR